MVILGIDPGYAIVGYGAVETVRGNNRMLAYGAITTPAHKPMERRLHEIYTDMKTLLDT
ncbi:MAG: crossover junction endodeoxyribonuclease RuvC, partial [Clostridia bacterium]|nr:crossover junction endodeoxyribonuclease RuvC [Clostridia bacterium]